MGISLEKDLRIAGYKATLFRDALVGFDRTKSPGNMVDLKSVFPLRRDGAIVFEECLDRGLIDPDTLRLTDAGEAISRAKAKSRTPLSQASALRSELQALDEGTRTRVELLVVMFREAVQRSNNLSHYIRQNIPFSDGQMNPAEAKSALAKDLVAELQHWIACLDNGTSEFDLDDLGVRVSRRSRPGNIVLSKRVLDALRGIVGT